eukprot:3955371-Karenia_brevis.AAC.1
MDICDSMQTELSASSWKECGWWAIDTTNPNSLTSGEAAILEKDEADAVIMVETKQAGEAGANRVRSAARKCGWKA